MSTNRKLYLHIPIDKHDAALAVTDVNAELHNTVTHVLLNEDYRSLLGVFNDWNESFNICIEIAEEEILRSEDVPKALRILQHRIAKSQDVKFLDAAARLKTALDIAIFFNAPVILDF